MLPRLLLIPTAALALSRDVFSMSKWANQQGIVMHENMQWKQYDPDDDANWGLELKEPVPAGTTLLQVPKDLVLDADSIRKEFQATHGSDKLSRALERLGDFGIHTGAFLIALKLLRCSKDEESRWKPWIQGLPKTFVEFSSQERDCLPYYARAAAVYQEKQLQAFCQAAEELDELETDNDRAKFKWAFDVVSSRCWRTAPSTSGDGETDDRKTETELVPIGDMFNHREPPNVALTHDDDSVNFVYKGDANDEKGLYLTYGSPSNPHRFLVVFGFVSDDMPKVWSHIVFPNNPFAEDSSKMVFGTADGAIPDIVWDAVLYAFLQRQGVPFESNLYTKEEMHVNYRFATLGYLKNHVKNVLDELALLRQKMETADGENMDLIRKQNEFLTKVFSRVQTQLEKEEPV